MFETIMVPVDGSNYSKKAVKVAIEVASKFNSKIAAVHVLEEFSMNPYAEEEDKGDEILAYVTEEASKKGIDVIEHLITGNPIHDMKTIIRKTCADLVVVHSLGKDTNEEDEYEYKIGSVVEKVIRTSEIPILLLK